MCCWPTSGGHADVRGDDALDLVVMNQLRDAEELLAAKADRAAHVVGDRGRVVAGLITSY